MHDVMQSDALAIADTDGFGEEMTYHPYPSSVASISFVGLVFRNPPGEIADGNLRGKRIVVFVPKAAVSAINAGGVEQISLAERRGGATSKFTVSQLIGQDGGWWKVRVG